MESAQSSMTGNRITVTHGFLPENFRSTLACIHDGIENHGYQDLVLEFEKCEIVDPGLMLMLCAQILNYRRLHEDVEFDLVLPGDLRQARLFENTNWAYLINEKKYAMSNINSRLYVPVKQFSDEVDHVKVVNRIVDGVLRSLQSNDLSRQDITAIEWVVNEVTDNVLQHSESEIGGLAFFRTFPDRNGIEYAIADAGIGIPRSIRNHPSEIESDGEALEWAIKEGRKSDSSPGQGNGLFGSHQLSRKSGSHFHIQSGHASLICLNETSEPRSREEKVPCTGTLVVGGIHTSEPGVLSRALRFRGKPYQSTTDAIERYEDKTIQMHEELSSFGSRRAAEPFRRKLEHLVNMDVVIRLNFSEVLIVSSSFADEVFGKLFAKIGPVHFANRISILGANREVAGLIDRAIRMRAASG